MAVSKTQKTEILEEVKNLIKDSKSIAFTSNTGLTVEEVSKLRKDLRTVNASFKLAKKTLIKIAFKEIYNVEVSDDLLPGQIAMVCSKDDAIAGMSKVSAFAKPKKMQAKIKFVGSYFEGELRNANETSAIANMPSRETLLGRLVGSMKSPISALARFFDAAAKDLETKGKSKVSELTVEK